MKLKLITRVLTVCTLSTIQMTNFNIVNTAQIEIWSPKKRDCEAAYRTKYAFRTRPLLVHPLDWYTYFKQLDQILKVDLKNAGIVKEVEHDNNLLKNPKKWYVIDPNPPLDYYNAIKIPLNLYRRDDPENRFALIFDTDTFHLQGFEWKSTWRNKKLLHYYYFNDSVITNLDIKKELLKEKRERYYKKLNINSNYEIFKNKKFVFTLDQAYQSFFQLLRTDFDPHERSIAQTDIETIMLVTLEALKFRESEKLCDIDSKLVPDAINQWKNYFTEVIDEWGRNNDEGKTIAKNIIEEGNINNLVLSNYQELVLPPTMFSMIKKNVATGKYYFQLKRLDLYYDESKKDQEVTYSSTSKTDFKNCKIYDFNLKRIDPVKFKKFIFIDYSADQIFYQQEHRYMCGLLDICWGVKVQWGGTMIVDDWSRINCSLYKDTEYFKLPENHLPPGYAVNGKTLNSFAKTIDFDLRKILKKQKINKDSSSWEEISAAASCELQRIYRTEGAARLSAWQKFGLTWYYDEQEHEYHLQLIIYQYLEEWTSSATLIGSIKIGRGIRISGYSD